MNINIAKGKASIAKHHLYIDQVNGNDANDGSSEHPLRTFAGAKSKFAGNLQPVVVDFVSDYSCSQDDKIELINSVKPITLTTSNNSCINGVKQIENFTVSGGLVEFDTDVEPFCIYVNSEKRDICSSYDLRNLYPNNSNLVFRDLTDYSAVPVVSQCRITGDIGVEPTPDTILQICAGWETLFLNNLTEIGENDYTAYCNFSRFFSSHYKRYFRVINHEDCLDKGTFMYTKNTEGDSDTYHVIYKIKDGESITTSDIISIPAQETLIDLRYSANVSITGLNFFGNREDIFIEHGQGGNTGYDSYCINILSCGNINIIDCSFKYIFGYCICFGDNTQHLRIENCVFKNLYGGGAYSKNLSNDVNNPDDSGNFVFNHNVINGFGRLEVEKCGMFLSSIHDSIISNNTVMDGFYTGISIGDKWSYGTTKLNNVYIGHNHIHHCMTFLLNDGGGLYIVAKATDVLVEFNSIHDVYGENWHANGIYCDTGAAYATFRYNWIYGCSNGYYQDFNHWNKLFSNFIAFSVRNAFLCGLYNAINVSSLISNNVIIDSSVNYGAFSQNNLDSSYIFRNLVFTEKQPQTISYGRENVFADLLDYSKILNLNDLGDNFAYIRGTNINGFNIAGGSPSNGSDFYHTSYSCGCIVGEGAEAHESDETQPIEVLLVDGQPASIENYYKNKARIIGDGNSDIENNSYINFIKQ